MSRRKQAKPRAVKRETDDEESLVDVEEEERIILVDVDGEEKSSFLHGSTEDDSHDDSAIAADEEEDIDVEEDDDDVNDDEISDVGTAPPGDDEDDDYRCEMCNSSFTSLLEFMDHRNYICGEGDSQTLDDGTLSRSSTPLSADALKSQFTFDGTTVEDGDIPYSIGTDETHPYSCQFCQKAFTRLSHLKKHEQVHSDLLPFKCNFCNRLFRHKRSRDRHVKLHTGDKKHKCTKCDSAFARSDHLKIHLKSHDNGKPFRCTVCSRGYTNSAALTSHMLFHKKYPTTDSPSKGFKCTHCNVQFSAAKELQEHNKTHHRDLKQCENIPIEEDIEKIEIKTEPMAEVDQQPQQLAPSMSSVINEPQSHPLSLVIHESPNTKLVDTNDALSNYDKTQAYAELICEFCLKSGFSNKDVLDMHIQMVHAGKSKAPYLCPFCNAAYPTFYNLAEHVKILHEPLFSSKHPFQCDFCNKEFKSAEEIKHHKDKHHKMTSVSTSSTITCFCPACNIAFSNQNTLAEHVQLVHQTHSFSHQRQQHLQRSPDRKRSADHLNTSPSPQQPLKIPKIHTSPTQPEHRSSQTSDDLEINNCDHCGVRFYDQTIFKEHLRSHFALTSASVSCESSLPVTSSTQISQPSSSVTSSAAIITSVNGERTPNCPECRIEFTSQEELETHVITHYLSSTTEYGCTSCLKLFSKPDELQKHLMDIHAHHLYRCSLCKEIFDSKVNVQVHFAIKHSNECKLYKCTLCSTIFRSEMEWQLHVKVQHLHISKPYRCLFCKDSFSTEMELQVHLTAHKKQYQCPLCAEAFHVEYQLDKHMHSNHSQDTTTTTSSMHESEFKQPTLLNGSYDSDINRGHISPSKANNKDDEKLRCDAKFADETAMLSHLNPSHSVLGMTSPNGHRSPQNNESTTVKSLDLSLPDKFSNACVYCNQTFKTKGELEKHMKVHATPSSLKCNICDEVFPSSNILAEHKLIHCKVVQGNVCVICKFTLKNENQFYFHSEQHGLQGTNMQCVICRQTLMSSVELNMHAKFHFQNSHSFFTCCVCLKTFGTKENLVAKLNSSGRAYYVCKPCYHGHDEEHQCGQCTKAFGTKTELDVHMTSHHSARIFRPNSSPKPELKTSPDSTKNKSSKSAKSFFTCCVCLKTFDDQEQLVPKLNASGRAYYVCKPCYHGNDSSSVVTTEFTCDWCGITLHSKELLNEHVKIHKKTYQCIKCQEAFNTEYEIQMHVATHMIQEGNVHECHICDQIFESPAKLQCHLIEHTFEGLREFCCYICNTIFTQPGAIQSHVLEHGISARKYSCIQCNQRFFFSAELQNHLYIHGIKVERSGSTDNQCHDCDKVFPSVAELNVHLKIHSDKRIKCPMCPQSYLSILDLQQHFMKNHGEAALMEKCYLQCPVCDKETNSFSSLYSHMKVHGTGKENRNSPMKIQTGKPFNCSVCLKTFFKKSQMKEHMASHFNQQYRCELCEESFPQLRLLNHHNSTAHKDDISTKSISDNNNSPSINICNDMSSDDNQTVPSKQLSVVDEPEKEFNHGIIIKTEISEYKSQQIQVEAAS